MITFLKAKSNGHFDIIERLAYEIWTEYYTPIIGSGQVEYMLNKFQNAAAIEEQIREGYSYYLIKQGGNDIGYLSFKEEPEALFLSKIYVSLELRKTGVGSSAMKFLEEHARLAGLKNIRLTVNKHNKSKEAYLKMGFKDCGSVVMDIGAGYVMDDFAMEKHLE
ncbi:MAG: GNAT family N-acetyltransferase [Cyclobacteriaceae bacterium]